HRNFRLFLGGQFLSICGTWMQTVAHGWLVLTLTNSALAVGLVTAVGALPILLFTLYGGVLADRVDKHRLILILQSLMLCEALALGVLTAFHWVTVSWVVALAIMFGLLTAFEVPTRQAFVMDLVGKDDLMNAIALNSSAFNVARVIGPAIAGTLIAAVGIAACFFANAISYIAVIGGLLMMRMPAWTPAPAGERGPGEGLAEGFRYIRRERWPRTLILLTATLSVFGYSFISMLPVYARDVVKVGPGGYAAMLSSFGAGAAAGALTVAALGRRVRQGRAAVGGAGIFGALLLASAFAPTLVSAMLLFMVAGCAMTVHGITANTLLQRQAPDKLRGRVMGFYSFVALGMAPFGSLQAGVVSERFGVRASFAVGGVACVVAAGLVAWRALRSPGVFRASAPQPYL
ncbi:MAG: MFS transporter, partial [Gemmatimonadota bacterium]